MSVVMAPEVSPKPEAPWLGEVPTHWRTVPLWSMFRREKRTGFVDEPMVSVFREHGVVFKADHDNLNVTAEDRSIYQLVEPGWLVVNRMKAWQGSVGVSRIRGISSGHYLCFRPLHPEAPSYLNWLLRSLPYRDAFALNSRGVRPGQAEIDNGQLRQMPVLLPPLDEQRAIADYLDRETAQIDALIEKQQSLIDRLRERRSAVIGQALARAGKGGTRRFGNMVQLVTEPATAPDFKVAAEMVESQAGALIPGSAVEVADPGTQFRDGDVLFGKLRPYLAKAWEADRDGGAVGDLHVYRPGDGVDSRFVLYLVLNREFVELVNAASYGTKMPRASWDHIKTIEVAAPAHDEQHAIADRLDRETGKIDALIAKAQRFIELAGERRSALVIAAVTGQLEITTVTKEKAA